MRVVPRPGEDAGAFRTEVRELAEALRDLFHAVLLREIGMPKDLLLRALTQTGIGSIRVGGR
jgi:hypothetical protein